MGGIELLAVLNSPASEQLNTENFTALPWFLPVLLARETRGVEIFRNVKFEGNPCF